MVRNEVGFDSSFDEKERLPRIMMVEFEAIETDTKPKVVISVNGVQFGDVIDDNSRNSDGYRFHDVFHFTFATLLGWSPCTRALMKRKRKSVACIDEIEDGARATITEEAISLIVFSQAKQSNFFEGSTFVRNSLLDQIKMMTAPFEVSKKSKKNWENAILTGYQLFRDLVKNNGGRVHFDMDLQTAIYERSN